MTAKEIGNIPHPIICAGKYVGALAQTPFTISYICNKKKNKFIDLSRV